MRRLPIYFLIDVSESMVGEPIGHVRDGMQRIMAELRTDPYALETAYVSVIVFAGKALTAVPLTELTLFHLPDLSIGGGTSLGVALDVLMDDIDANVRRTTFNEKGDWRPIVFLFTDGTPTDDVGPAFRRWNGKYRDHANLVVVSIGNNADTRLLGRISDNVLRLRKTDEMSFKSFFKWISDTIRTSSQSVSEGLGDTLALPRRTSIDLEKVDTKVPCMIDEHFAVLLCRCQKTKGHYLIKYGKCASDGDESGSGMQDGFDLVGSYPVDGEAYDRLSDGRQTGGNINTKGIRGNPSCPHCGSEGLVLCGRCRKLCCADQDVKTCPWCGSKFDGFKYGHFDMDRTRG